MPNIDVVQPVYYDSDYPYFIHYDNLPLKNIVVRQELINSAVENQREVLVEAIGTQGTLSNRLNRSLQDNGALKTSAVNDSMHSIAYHTDGSYNDGISIISYVRMTSDERSKLALVSDNATALSMRVATPSTTVLFDDESIELIASPTITWSVVNTNQVKANLTFATTALHNHYYDQTPVHENVGSPDYQNYKVNLLATAYKEGSLRVYVNGIRLSADHSVYVPAGSGPDGDWTLTSVTPTPDTGRFVISRALAANDVVTIDYDIQVAS